MWHHPSVETLGYFHLSLRDTHIRISATHWSKRKDARHFLAFRRRASVGCDFCLDEGSNRLNAFHSTIALRRAAGGQLVVVVIVQNRRVVEHGPARRQVGLYLVRQFPCKTAEQTVRVDDRVADRRGVR